MQRPNQLLKITLEPISSYNSYNFVFPMAYCNGALHVGHCYVLMQIDVRARYLKSLSKQVNFIFPWHLTGIHIPLTFNKLLNKDKIIINNLASAFALDLSEINETLLRIKTLQEYITFIQTNNRISVEDLKICVNWETTHGTSTLQPAYNSFVTWIFNKLETAKLIKQAMHYIIWCDSCKHAIGDHDRAEGQNVYITKYNFLKVVVPEETNRFLIILNTDNSCEYLISSDSKIYHNIELNEQWILTQFMLSLFVNYTFELIGIYRTTKTEYLINSNSLNLRKIGTNSDFKQNFFTEKVVCRCGTVAIIKKTLQNFICYSDVSWKDKTKKYIGNLVISEFARKLLYNQLQNLNDWPFSRSVGIGSYYKNRLIDPLSDSTMFMFFSLFNKELQKQPYSLEFWDNVMCGVAKSDLEIKLKEILSDSLNSYCVETTGKDLLSNHILFTLFFQAMFDLNLTKEVNALGFILHDNTKMSKSKLNTVYISDFKNENIDLIRYYLTTISEELKDGDFSTVTLENLKRDYETSLKLYELWQVRSFTNYREEDTLFDYEFLKESIIIISKFKISIEGKQNTAGKISNQGKLKTAYGLISRDLQSITKTYLELVNYTPTIAIITLLHKFLNASLSLILVLEISDKFSLSQVYSDALDILKTKLSEQDLTIFSAAPFSLDRLKKDISEFLGNRKNVRLNIIFRDKSFCEIYKSNLQLEKYFSGKYDVLTKIMYNPNITRDILLNND